MFEEMACTQSMIPLQTFDTFLHVKLCVTPGVIVQVFRLSSTDYQITLHL